MVAVSRSNSAPDSSRYTTWPSSSSSLTITWLSTLSPQGETADNCNRPHILSSAEEIPAGPMSSWHAQCGSWDAILAQRIASRCSLIPWLRMYPPCPWALRSGNKPNTSVSWWGPCSRNRRSLSTSETLGGSSKSRAGLGNCSSRHS
jgi:hypothetical protein